MQFIFLIMPCSTLIIVQRHCIKNQALLNALGWGYVKNHHHPGTLEK
jgi:hypothetical protein